MSVESGFQPFAIRINTDRPLAEQPKTRAEAIETATTLIAEGHDIDLGLGGINSGNLGRLGLSVSDTFDFCLNIKASAALLEGYYQIALQGGATTAQAEVVMLRSYFGNGDASVGEMVGYDKKVLAERERLSSQLDSIEIVEAQAQALPARERAGELFCRHGRQRSGREEPAAVPGFSAAMGCLQRGAAILRPRLFQRAKGVMSP
ncbi:lytic transglycosylase domain-containing protein [Sinorhizobium meliloti]